MLPLNRVPNAFPSAGPTRCSPPSVPLWASLHGAPSIGPVKQIPYSEFHPGGPLKGILSRGHPQGVVNGWAPPDCPLKQVSSRV